MHTPHLNAFNAPIRGLFLVALLNGLLLSALHASENHPSDIHWMTSGVEAAITEATRTNKPVFIYWGADWCPPCARLKATLFRDPQFINKSRQFVMLYLDGDSINAQQEAERLNVTGYPTLVLLDQHGQERMRVSGGLQIDRYPEVMDLMLTGFKPVDQLVNDILYNAYQPNHAELTVLAYHAWRQDSSLSEEAASRLPLFEKLATQTPRSEAVLRSRFDAQFVMNLARIGNPVPRLINLGLEKTRFILSDQALYESNPGLTVFNLSSVIETVTLAGSPEREVLLNLWHERLTAGLSKGSASAEDQLWRYFSLAKYYQASNKTFPATLRQEIYSVANQALGETYNDAEKVIVTYAGYQALKESGAQESARQLLEEQINVKQNPSYWMLILANLDQHNENPTSALSWFRSAFEESQGTATRLQWGSYYLAGLTSLAPNRDKEIMQLSTVLTEQITASEDGISGRNRKAIKRIMGALHDWASSEIREQYVRDVENAIETSCVRYFSTTASLDSCLELTDYSL